ncbi:MAG: hypothetical protein LBE30_17995 [Comamonas sp.]|jgi:hypothetical protein|nr:hypothetical protein [Comamonas sp.]
MQNSWLPCSGLKMGAAMVAIAAAALMAGCSDSKNEAPAAAATATPAPAPAAAAPETKRVIDQLFDTETIGMNLAYVEKIAGPAMRSESHRHQFRTDGCEVTLVSDDADKVINSMEVSISPSCNLSLEPVLGSTAGEPATRLGELSFGRFEQMLGGNYYADCLTLCGNAADPVVYLQAEGSRATGFMDFAVQAPMVEDTVLDATSAWRDAMTKAESEDYVLDTRFNCEPQRFKDVIASGLKNAKPTVFSFGRGLKFEQGDCN